MKTRIIYALFLLSLLLMGLILLNSCSSSNHAASYPVVHKLKNEKFAGNIKPKNKIRDGELSSVRARGAEPNTTGIGAGGLQQAENRAVPPLPRLENDVSSRPSESVPDIVSTDKNIGVVNYHPASKDPWSKAFNYSKQNVKESRLALAGAFSPNGKGDDDTPVYGILSVMLGIMGLTVFSYLLGAFGLLFFGVMALGMGIMGINKKSKALAIIGMVLGILCIILGFLALGFV